MFLRRRLRLEELRSQGFEDGLLDYDAPMDLADSAERTAYTAGRDRGEAAAVKLGARKRRGPEPIGGYSRR